MFCSEYCRYPGIEFVPYSVSFTCPRCTNTCNCDLCCNRRNVEYIPSSRRTWRDLGVPLLLSESATLRLQRTGRAEVPRRRKEDRLTPRTRKEEKAVTKTNVDIGEEAEKWIRLQNEPHRNTGKALGRAFLGSWQDSWGPPPAVIRAMSCVELDAHTAPEKGKGKAKAVFVESRLYVGDVHGLHRPLSRASDIQVPARKRRGRPPAKTHKITADEDVLDEHEPPKKKRRVMKQSVHVPEFTLNHQESVASSAAPSMHLPTPDDFTVPSLESNGHLASALWYSPHDAKHDSTLSVIEHGPDSDGLGNAYGFDWERSMDVGMKPFSAFDDPVFACQEPFDSYALTLGAATTFAEPFDSPGASFGYGLGPVFSATQRNHDSIVSVHDSASLDPEFSSSMIDPILLEQEETVLSDHKAAYHNSVVEDRSKFFTQNACASTVMAGPMIFGTPSATGLSQDELALAMRRGLAAVKSAK
ncbi:hypothetical protein DFH11DRAFT_363925 [Phellopilus nigrolimitatus]|nr:hypothetical protein DFH11DRAFT_363925 [Phellopilus nigrolimitatus]